MKALQTLGRGLRTFGSDIVQGFFEITHNGFALIGLIVAFFALSALARPDLRQSAELELMDWLQQRHVTVVEAEPEAEAEQADEHVAVERATASDPRDLPKQQAAVAFWLSKKYRVAPEPLSTLVAQAYESGRIARIDPTLILAVMAVESGFNPFAQSAVGAQGLMQVMTRVHTAKYDSFGGKLAAFDPVANLKVGAKVLQECIARAGSVEGGLRFYVGSGPGEEGNGYASKVMAEHVRLQSIAAGRTVPVTVPPSTPLVAPVPLDAPASSPAPAEPEKVAALFSS